MKEPVELCQSVDLESFIRDHYFDLARADALLIEQPGGLEMIADMLRNGKLHVRGGLAP